MVLNSYAKINLSLLVNSKQKKGLHNIQSFFCLINLKDRIKIKKIKGHKDIINFIGTFARAVDKKNNSIKSLLNLLRKIKLIRSYFSITVEKKIPVLAGLGGGTSNAFSVMKYVVKDKINDKNFDIIRKLVGTDLRLFFYKQGFLKNLRSVIYFKKKQNFFFILIQPSIKCSTREVYSKIKKYSKKINFNKKNINKREKLLHLLSNSKNDLQSVVEKKYPEIKKILKFIETQKGCCFSRMTGSGSVCYGLFIDQNSAKKALNKLRTKYPKFWVRLAKTV